MQTRYENLLDELHTHKRELCNYRQRYLSLQSQLLALHQQNRNHKKTISTLKDTNQKLTELSKALQAQKQSLISDYSTSVQSIKEEINKKQHEIYVLKQNTFSPLANQNQKLLQKQIRCELQSEFQEQLQAKQKRIRELLQQSDRLNFEKAVQKQKYELKVQGLQKQFRQMQSAQLVELQNYANKTYQNCQSTRLSEEQVQIKRQRRQIEELRITLDSAQQQLNESVMQKTKIQKQLSFTITKHKAQIQSYAEQIRALQYQNKTSNQFKGRNKTEREQGILRQKQKEIKSLKDQIEELYWKLNKKEAAYSELEVELVTKTNQINKLRDLNSKQDNETIKELKTEKQKYRRQISELRNINENIRKQNLEMMCLLTELNLKSVKDLKQHQNAISKQATISKQLRQVYLSPENRRGTVPYSKPSIAEQNQESPQSKAASKPTANLHRVKSSQNLRGQTDKSETYKTYYEEECRRNKELSLKYVELKKKYKNLEDKFNQANTKLVDLLKDKIQLGSPTATSKKSFEFPLSPPQTYLPSSDPFQNHITQQPQQNQNLSRTQGRLNSLIMQIGSPDLKTLKAKRTERPERSQSKPSPDQSFYEKSLKIKKTHKFKEIKCLNHDDSQYDQAACSHSPSN